MIRSKRWLQHNQVVIYAVAVLLAIGVGLELPSARSVLEALINPVLAVLLYVTFLEIPFVRIRQAFRNTRFMAAALGMNFLVVPVVVFGLTRLLPQEPVILVGAFMVLLTPCIDYVITFTELAGGDAEQIENSSRGHIPDDPQMLLQRMEDEQVRQALERGCSRERIADVLGTTRRTTFTKEKRALAMDFPLEAFNRGGRPSTSNTIGGEPAIESETEDTTAQTELGKEDSTPETATSEETVGAAGERGDDERPDDADPVEIWKRHHDRPFPVQLTPHVSDLATDRDPKEVQKQLPDDLTPLQVINALLTSPRS